jgi:hypothetical protein
LCVSAQVRKTRSKTHDIIIERSYIHGDPKAGSKRGIAPNGSKIVIRDSYINDHKSNSKDSQAISCWNRDLGELVGERADRHQINLKPGAAARVNPPRTEDVVVENNLLSGGLLGIALSGTDVQNPKVGVGTLKRVTIRNNVLQNLGGPPWGGAARLMQFAMSLPAKTLPSRTTPSSVPKWLPPSC